MHYDDLYSEQPGWRDRLTELLREGRKDTPSDFFGSEFTRELHVRASAGDLRVLHHRPPGAAGRRPVVFLPGWGTQPEGFGDFFRMINEKIECYYVETREKNSSRLPEPGVEMGMDRNGMDLREVLRELGLEDENSGTNENSGTAGRDFVLMGTCWGSTVIVHALARGFVSAPTTIIFDPMPRLWFPQWLLHTLIALMPVPMLNLIRPVGRGIALWGMKEEVQRRRAEDFINGADLGKWKRAALAIGDYDLHEVLRGISREVFVFTGVPDKIHDRSRYPKIAAMIPGGRFFYLPVDESDREYLLGLIAREFSTISAAEGAPENFREFEKKIPRE